jgi:hypothetical protein
MLLLSLVFINFLLCLQGMILSLINALRGGWAIGSLGCSVSQISFITGTAISFFSLMSINLERYYAIIRNYSVGEFSTISLISFYWFLSLLLGFAPHFTNSFSISVSLSSANLICAFNWSSSQPLPILLTWICLLIGISGFATIAWSYYEIVTYFRKNSTISKKTKDLDLLLTRKAILITVSFIGFWGLYVVFIFGAMVTHQEWSPVLDVWMTVSGLVYNCSLTPR